MRTGAYRFTHIPARKVNKQSTFLGGPHDGSTSWSRRRGGPLRTIRSVQRTDYDIREWFLEAKCGGSPRGLGGRVGWSTVWPASCVARFSPRFPPRGRSTPGFLSALQLAPAMCLLDFGVPFDSNRCPLCTGLLNTRYQNGNREYDFTFRQQRLAGGNAHNTERKNS